MALEQEGFRWRDDNGLEEASPGASYLAAQDTNGVSVGVDTAIRLRFVVNAAGASPGASKYRLEARLTSPSVGDWFEVEAAGSPGGNPRIRLKPSTFITAGGEDTTAQLNVPAGSPKSFLAGRIWDDESGQDTITLGNDQYTELEFCLEAVSANGAAASDVYEFRVTRKEAAGGGGAQVTPTLLGSGTASMDVSSFPTASVSPNSNEVVYICFAISFPAQPAETDIFSVSGCGLTWERVAEVYVERRTIGVFRALGTASAGVITVSESSAQAAGGQTVAYSVVQFANASTAGTNGSGATGTPATVSNTTGTSGGLTIAGTPGSNDATFAYFVLEDAATSPSSDALWVNLDSETGGGDFAACLTDWDTDADQSPTWTWTNNARHAGIGFIVVAA